MMGGKAAQSTVSFRAREAESGWEFTPTAKSREVARLEKETMVKLQLTCVHLKERVKKQNNYNSSSKTGGGGKTKQGVEAKLKG